jgi:DNA-binding SARP family transcriptional activator/TolB-like protein
MQPENSSRLSAERAQDAVLEIRLLGDFRLRVQDRDVILKSRKTQALVGYLALSDSRQESRERLVGLLWSDSPEEKARASLRQALHELRSALQPAGFDGFRTDKLGVTLDRQYIRVDVTEMVTTADGGQPHPCLLDGGDPTERLFAGIENADPMFQSWVAAKRQTVRDQTIRKLENSLRQQNRSLASARNLASAILSLDPTHEEACRLLIRLYAAAGETSTALRIYKNLWDLLERDYDVEPSQQTQDLIAEIKMALPLNGVASGGAAGAPRLPEAAASFIDRPADFDRALPDVGLDHFSKVRHGSEKLVLSVRPFILAGGPTTREHLAKGFRRELIGCLVRFRECQVRDANIVAPDGDRKTIDHEYVLEASGYETRNAVQFVLTLQDNVSGAYLWSESLKLTLESWRQSQQVVVRRIATALNVHVSAERVLHITGQQKLDLKAYDVWLYGQATLLGFNQNRWEDAAELFRKVVHQMPRFAPAYSSLAQLNNSYHIVKPGVSRSADRTRQALAYAHEAVRLDPLDSRSQLCLGWSHAMAKQYDQAMLYIPLAYDLNDNDPWTRVSAANCYAFCGHHKRAIEIVEAILREKVPFAQAQLPWAYITATRFMAGDYKGCILAADLASDLNANVPAFKCAALFHIGEHDAAVAELERFFATVAARWTLKEPAHREAMTRWLLHMFPIARVQDWERLRDGLAGAGAPVGRMTHHEW